MFFTSNSTWAPHVKVCFRLALRRFGQPSVSSVQIARNNFPQFASPNSAHAKRLNSVLPSVLGPQVRIVRVPPASLLNYLSISISLISGASEASIKLIIVIKNLDPSSFFAGKAQFDLTVRKRVIVIYLVHAFMVYVQLNY